MNISFYFDPSCPYCWITSRWIIQAASQREINVTWKPFSLALKNNAFEDRTKPHAESAIAAHRVIRLMLASGKDIGEMYTSFGTKHHIYGEDFNDDLIKTVLKEEDLSEDLLSSADDETIDDKIRTSTDEAVKLVGQDIGVPTIVFEDNDKKIGYFGPVLLRLPSVTESVKLWDSLTQLATSEHFYELKRGRPESGPETASTAICVP